MSLVINTNSIATVARRNIASAQDSLKRSLARLSSGSNIADAQDDPGAVAVATKLRGELSRNIRSQQNVQNAISFLQVQDGALKVVTNI